MPRFDKTPCGFLHNLADVLGAAIQLQFPKSSEEFAKSLRNDVALRSFMSPSPSIGRESSSTSCKAVVDEKSFLRAWRARKLRGHYENKDKNRIQVCTHTHGDWKWRCAFSSEDVIMGLSLPLNNIHPNVIGKPGPISCPSLRRSARAPTAKAVKETVAMEGVFGSP